MNNPSLVDSSLNVNLNDLDWSFLVGCDQEMAIHQMDFFVFRVFKNKPKILGYIRVVVQDLEGLSYVGITLAQGAHE